MKRSLGLSFLALLMSAFAGLAAAQTANTVGGTVITNTATATYVDANAVARSAASNQVSTTVQTVYGFNVAPGEAPTEPTDFLTEPAANVVASAGQSVSVDYTVTNTTNGPINISLSVLQAAGEFDDFDLDDVIIEISFDGGATFAPYDPNLGVDLASQNDAVVVRVSGTIPAGATGNEFALFDLVAINNSAVDAGQNGPYISYDTNNIGRVNVAAGPAISLDKSVEDVVNNGDGSYTVTYEFTVQNTGNVALGAVQVTDDLAAAFAGATSFSVTGLSASGLTANSGSFNGTSNQNLLSGNDTLAIGASGTITLAVRVVAGGNFGPYVNSADAVGTSGGAQYTDSSDAPPVDLVQSLGLGLAKDATILDRGPNDNGPFTIQFDFYLANTGDVIISGLGLVDDLDEVFGANNYSVTSGPTVIASSASPTVIVANSSFDGSATNDLLAAGSALAAGGTAQIRIVVTVTAPGVYANSVTLTGLSPSGQPLERDSTPGTDPDPELDPGATVVSLSSLDLVKRVVICSSASDCSGAPTTESTVVNPGQYIQYSIEVTNQGGSTITGVVVFDDIPNATGLVTGSLTASASATCVVQGPASASYSCPTTATPGSIDAGATSVSWEIGSLISDQTVTVSFLVQVE